MGTEGVAEKAWTVGCDRGMEREIIYIYNKIYLCKCTLWRQVHGIQYIQVYCIYHIHILHDGEEEENGESDGEEKGGEEGREG